ncbi:hypothetical protein LTR17_016437 [Elasticomyces elasticus]|nr:hypothetical protein LTR17_016437 [Elasticomyces elasticus]
MAERPSEPESHGAPHSGKAHPRSHSEAEAAAGIVPNHGISINFPDDVAGHSSRPHPVKHMSAPSGPPRSPLRHHKRTPSKSKPVKETLNARSHYGSSDDDSGASVHRINQYIIKQEIGRGSFGAVHLAVDQYGSEYAVKEFSKSRLRKRAQSNLLRKPNQQAARRPGHLAAGMGFNSPLHRLSSNDKLKQSNESNNNNLELIKEEIAIMKKLNHNNLVALIEVLDDPQEDSLYMVLEMCKKGVVMKVGLDERAEPYTSEICRTWFRDMILGIEYLHAQGIIHRDIKPDNCLITQDDVLKIVDFGVSEMFEKDQDLLTAKSAGSPAFMPPELCVARHGRVEGRAADVWSMGVTLYCLRYGHIPFERNGLLELYESIREQEVPLDEESDDNFRDMMKRMLEKDPERRITITEIREHPWVTNNGTDPLLPTAENCADLVDTPTASEVEHAITGNMAYLMVVMKAVKRFKQILHRKRPASIQGLFGRDSKIVGIPKSINPMSRTRSSDAHDRRPMDSILVTDGVHRDVKIDDQMRKLPLQMNDLRVAEPWLELGERYEPKGPRETGAVHKQREEADGHKLSLPSEPNIHRETSHPTETKTDHKPPRPVLEDDHAKGHAHDPLHDRLFLGIGPTNAPDTFELPADGGDDNPKHIVSGSPAEVEMNIYEEAYQKEVERILEKRGQDAEFHLTRRVEHREDLRSMPNIIDSGREMASSAAEKLSGLAVKAREGSSAADGGLASLVKKAREQGGEVEMEQESSEDSEDPPLQAPQLDGSKEDTTVDVPKSIIEAQAQAQAHLDAADGAMPGMPGGFPTFAGMEDLEQKQLKTSANVTYTYHVSPASNGKPTLLLLHGCPDTFSLWSDLVTSHLLPAGYGVLAPDLIGYGRSEKPAALEHYVLTNICGDLAAMLEHESIKQAIVVGHDFGAALASRMCHVQPSYVAGLITLGTAYIPPSPYPFNFEQIRAMQEQYLGYCSMWYFGLFTSEEGGKVLDAHVEQMFTALHGGGQRMKEILCVEGGIEKWLDDDAKKDVEVLPYAREPAFRQEWVGRLKRDGFTAPLKWYKAIISNMDLEAQQQALERGTGVLNMPYLFVAALQDPLAPTAAVQGPIAQGMLPDVSIKEVEAGHWCMFEKPQEVGNAVVSFLSEKY